MQTRLLTYSIHTFTLLFAFLCCVLTLLLDERESGEVGASFVSFAGEMHFLVVLFGLLSLQLFPAQRPHSTLVLHCGERGGPCGVTVERSLTTGSNLGRSAYQ